MEMGIRNLGQCFFIYHDSLLLQFEIELMHFLIERSYS